MSSPSLDGGLEEFRGVCLSRASSSAIRSRACASSSSTRASAACDSGSCLCPESPRQSTRFHNVPGGCLPFGIAASPL
jgi:hypothetical protein